MTRGSFLLLLGALAIYFVGPSAVIGGVLGAEVTSNFEAIALALAGA
jgi:hypothetical protein